MLALLNLLGCLPQAQSLLVEGRLLAVEAVQQVEAHRGSSDVTVQNKLA
jgi:hypothetical protein